MGMGIGMGMIGVLEITLIVPTLRVGMPLRTLRVRSRIWRRCVDKLQHYPRHALGSMNPQSVPFVTRSVTGCMPTRSEGHDQCQVLSPFTQRFMPKNAGAVPERVEPSWMPKVD